MRLQSGVMAIKAKTTTAVTAAIEARPDRHARQFDDAPREREHRAGRPEISQHRRLR